MKIIMTLMTFSLMIATSSTPFLSKAYSAGDMGTFKKLLSRNIRLGMALMITLASILAVFGDRVISLWIGAGNFVGFPVLWTLLVMLTLEVHHAIHAVSIMAAGHLVFLKVAIISGVIKIALSLLLSSYFGLWGVALGTMIAQLLTNNWYAPFISFKVLAISFKEYARTIYAPLALLLAVILLVNIVMRQLFDRLPDFGAVFAASVVSAIISAVITYSLVISSSERDAIMKKAIAWRMLP
jgi:O-antigen/teichoic acid export membrane protein